MSSGYIARACHFRGVLRSNTTAEELTSFFPHPGGAVEAGGRKRRGGGNISNSIIIRAFEPHHVTDQWDLKMALMIQTAVTSAGVKLSASRYATWNVAPPSSRLRGRGTGAFPANKEGPHGRRGRREVEGGAGVLGRMGLAYPGTSL